MDPLNQTPIPGVRTWERYISGIGFGVCILAAIGVFGYAAVLGHFARDLATLTRYAFVLIIIAFVLFVLEKAWTHFKPGGIVEIVVRCMVAFSIIAIPLFFLIWVGAYIGRDIGLLPQLRTEPTSYLLHPAGKAASHEINYDPKATLKRADARAMSFYVVQDPLHLGKLEGIAADFEPGEDEIEAVLILPYEVDGKPHRVRLLRVARTFDFVD